MAQEVFARTETKYILTQEEYADLFMKLKKKTKKDYYFASTNCSIYFDTPNCDLAIRSIEKPIFKEKIRLRSYNVPTLDDVVYLEIKTKYRGVGYKRRAGIKLRDFYDYQKTGILNIRNEQIRNEIDYRFKHRKLEPQVFIAYDRQSYCLKEDPNFRITFDFGIRSRTDNLRLEAGDDGELYYKDHRVIMEVKSAKAYPLWFSKMMNDRKIYPASNSKYSNIYRKINKQSKEK